MVTLCTVPFAMRLRLTATYDILHFLPHAVLAVPRATTYYRLTSSLLNDLCSSRLVRSDLLCVFVHFDFLRFGALSGALNLGPV